jgi:hypothetical protein
VNVARPSRWGNPYRVAEFGGDRAVALFEDHLTKSNMRSNLTILRGKNHAFWCASDERCHADVLLRLANA